MLLQFAVRNFRSFNEEVVLNMMPAKSRIHRDHVVASNDGGRKAPALPIAVLYGANASGKSNLLNAIAFAQHLIVNGTRANQPIPRMPFLLSSAGRESPSRFEFVFKTEGTVFSYGFCATEHEVGEEWLFATPGKREQRWFERATKEGHTEVRFGKSFAPNGNQMQRMNFVAEGTRPNQLFLSEAMERNVQQVAPIMNWFKTLVLVGPDAKYRPLVARAQSDSSFKKLLADVLEMSDTGISGIELEAEPLDRKAHLPGVGDEEYVRMLDALKQHPNDLVYVAEGRVPLVVSMGRDEIPQYLTLKTAHNDETGARIRFDAQNESDGSLRMMHLAPILAQQVAGETSIFLVDELDRSLHPHLCRAFLAAYLEGMRAGHIKGQLIVTTHETNLLDLELLRRDEIWFMEKDKNGASHLTSLAEFKYLVRSDQKVSRGYLAGRFGAIPFLGEPKNLFSRKKLPG